VFPPPVSARAPSGALAPGALAPGALALDDASYIEAELLANPLHLTLLASRGVIVPPELLPPAVRHLATGGPAQPPPPGAAQLPLGAAVATGGTGAPAPAALFSGYPLTAAGAAAGAGGLPSHGANRPVELDARDVIAGT
jgi:hypothetical protein